MVDRCLAFARELTAEVPEVSAVGFAIASPHLNPAVLSGIIAGPDGPTHDPSHLLQVTWALQRMLTVIYGERMPAILQGLEAIADDLARKIHDQTLLGVGDGTQWPS